MSETARRRSALVALIVATVIALAWALWPHPDAKLAPPPPSPQAIEPGIKMHPTVCHSPPAKSFVPTRIHVHKVAYNAEVLALPRDANDVPQAPPISNEGKTQFAWDKPTLKPGSPRGNVLINAHTWPDGTALGNRLLEHLQVGDRIIVRGKNAELCYRVTKRFVIRAVDGSFEYYEQDGPPRLALIVCSPPRLGPGNWENRTIWFASPIQQDGTLRR